jgi:hypothetical protein
MLNRRQVITPKQIEALQRQCNVLQNKNKNFNTSSPNWDQTPEMGLEALVATIDDRAKLLRALRKNILRNKRITMRQESS